MTHMDLAPCLHIITPMDLAPCSHIMDRQCLHFSMCLLVSMWIWTWGISMSPCGVSPCPNVDMDM